MCWRTKDEFDLAHQWRLIRQIYHLPADSGCHSIVMAKATPV
jgi:hypothetical protein